MSNKDSIGKRLTEERTRLELSQKATAELTGIALRSQQNYETGKRIPDAEYLAALAKLDIDIQYIVTGKRCVGATASLPSTEQVLLEMYRELSLDERVQLLTDLLISPLLERERLETAISAVMEGLAKTRRKLPPAKMNDLILAAYELTAPQAEA